MADNTDITSIKNDVGIIRQRFGGKSKVQMPSNQNDETKNEEKELDLMELVLLGMSSALFGEPKTSENSWESLFKNPENSLLFKINNSISDISTNIDKVLTEDNIKNIIGINNRLETLNTNLKTFNQNYNTLISKITDTTDVKSKDIKTQDNLNPIIESIKQGFENINITKDIQPHDINIINLNELKTLIDNFSEKVNSLSNISFSVNQPEKIEINTENLNDFITNFPESIKNSIQQGFENVNITNLSESIKNGIQQGFENVNITNLSESIKNSIQQGFENVNITNLSESIKNSIQQGFNGITTNNNNINTNKIVIESNIGDFGSFVDYLKDLKSDNKNSYIDNIVNGLTKLKTILNDKKVKVLLESINESLSTLFENINNNDNIDVDKIFKVTSIINNMMNMFSSKEDINTKNLRELFIQLSPNGYLKKIIEELNDIYKNKDKINISFSYLRELIESLILVGKIGPMERVMIKSNLKYIHNNIIDGIKELINDIGGIEEQNKSIYKSLDNISELFETIYKISSGGENFNKIKTKINLEYIKAMIFPSMLDIMNDLIELGNKANNEGNIAIEDINKLFDFVFKIGGYGILQLIKFDLKTRYFKDIIISNIKEGIIEEIINISEETYDIKNIIDLFDDISRFIGILDSIQIKLENLDKIKEIGFLFDNINQMPSLEQSKIDNLRNIETILNIFTTNDLLKGQNIQDILQNIDNVILASQKLQVLVNSIPDDYKQVNDFTNLDSTVNKILTIFSSYTNDSFMLDYSDISNLAKIFDEINKIIFSLEDLNKHIGNINFSDLTKFIQNNDLKTFLSEFAATGNNKTLLDYIKEINIAEDVDEKIKSINDVLTALSTLNKFSKLAKVFKIASLKPYKKLVEQVIDIVNLFKNVDENDIKKTTNTLKQMTIFIGAAAGILIAGALLFTFASWKGILMFPIVLTGFLLSLMPVFKLLSNMSFDNNLTIILDQMSDFIIKCGAMLLIGGFIMSIVSVENVVAFGFILSMFVLAMGMIAVAISSVFDPENVKFETLYLFKDYVTELAKILIIGSLAMLLVSWEAIAKFIVGLSAFIISMTAIAWGINKWFGQDKEIFDSLNKFKSYVVTCAGVMLLGSLIMRIIRMEDIVLFTTSLMIFITLVSLPFLMFNLFKKDVFKNAKDFAFLVIISAGIMTIGALFAKDVEFVENALLFGVALSGFIFLVTLPFILLSKKNLSMIMGTALAMSLLIVVCGGMLLVAGYFISQHPDILLGAVGFALGLTVFLVIMGGITYLLGHLAIEGAPFVLAGLAFIGGIMLLTFATIALIEYIHDKQSEGKLDITAAIGTIFNNFTYMFQKIMDLVKYITRPIEGAEWLTNIPIVGRIVSGIGRMGALSAGFGVVVVLSTLMLVACGSMALVSKALENVEMTSIKNKIDQLFETYTSVIDSCSKFDLTDIYEAWKGVKVLNQLSGALGNSAQALKLWSELKFPTKFDPKTGKPTEFVTIASGDFTTVSKNIDKVLTVLGNAVINAAKNNTDIFGDWGLFKDSPAMNAAKVIGVIGKSLIPVAKGIKEWVNLRIPTSFDKNGNPKGYETIHDRDFDQASKNIQKVLTCLGSAIVSTVKGNKEIFNDGVITKSPAIVAAKAIGIMGNTIHNIAHTIMELANGKIYNLDKNGKPVGEPIIFDAEKLKEITGDGENKGIIELLLTSLGNAITTVINDSNNKDIFNEGALTKAPAMIAANAIKGMADSILKVVEIIQKINKDPQFNKENIEKTLGDVKTKIKSIIQCIVESNEEIFNSINGMKGLNFNTDQNNKVNRSGLLAVVDFFTGKKTKVEYVGESVEEMTDTLKSLGDNINAILTITGILTQFSEKLKDKDGNEIDFNSNLQQLAGTGDKSIKKAIDYINDIKDTILQGIKPKIVVNGNNKIDSKEYYKYIENTVGALESCIKSIIKLSEISVSKNNNLGLAAIPGTVGQLLDKLTNKTTELNKFSKLVKDTKEFVQHINALDLNKMNTMQSLVKSIAELSEKLGSLDKFTEVLSTEITNVLSELILQLKKAEATITVAHELQNKRKQLINESIKEIKKIMGQHMVVEIYKNDKTGELSTNGSKNYVGNTNTSQKSSTNAESSNITPMGSPEDASLTSNKNDNNKTSKTSNNKGYDDNYLLKKIEAMFKKVPGYDE